MSVGPALEELLADQTKSNAAAMSFEELYAEHRARISLALSECPAGGRVAILGAGNALDLDGDALGARFDEVHLVDVDRAALLRAEERLAATVARGKVTSYAPLDVTGALTAAATFRAAPASCEEAAAVANDAAISATKALPRFDVVLSDCVLSQTFCACRAAWGDWPHLGAFRERIVRAHLTRMTSMLAPGGVGVLLTDVTSSDLAPIDDLVATLSPERLLATLTVTGKTFPAVAPHVVQGLLREDPALRDAVEDVRLLAPWLWRALPGRSYVVAGHRFRRRA